MQLFIFHNILFFGSNENFEISFRYLLTFKYHLNDLSCHNEHNTGSFGHMDGSTVSTGSTPIKTPPIKTTLL